jgi:hypothetical protein
MRRVLLTMMLILSGCDVREAPPGAARTAPVVPAPTAAVASAALAEEAIDSDNDGKIDTWRTLEPDGVIVESRDTNGDGKADTTQRFEPVEEPPPGIELKLDEKQ